ncbi:ATP-dependent RNA helicase DDX24 [Sitophilus oryzae]|uniref:ATP-dependent RNA helicase n=1 Tax=Sitophilus oryzae TaxID=7048 RepID=A0A6J2YR52_SITOR|nr:ATP-dependent RNA helicase DDX24 [Sitophilus oryzae]
MAIIAKHWKPVNLDGPILANIASEGLIGIEECFDYDLNDVITAKRKKNVKSQTKNKKLKTSEEVLTPSKQGFTSNNEESRNIEDEDINTLTAWDGYSLPTSILRALRDLNFEQPTEIQSITLPAAILGKRDILGAAETGSGKTLAFGLPILTGILRLKENEISEEVISDEDNNDCDNDLDVDKNGLGCVKVVKLEDQRAKKPLYALILTPTRELAMQVKNHIKNIAKYTNINVAVVVGGMAAVKQERVLSKGPEIVVGTPGRLWELIQQGNEHLSQISNIKFLAIDETDRMLEKGHFKELHDLLEKINFDEHSKKNRQNFIFSATLTLVHDIPRHLINKIKMKGRKISEMTPEQKLQKIVNTIGVTNPKIVDLSQGTGTSGTLTECRITCPIEEKDYYVYYFLKKHSGRTLIFCNSIGCVKRLTTLLTLLDCSPLPLHASMPQRQRLKNLDKFKDMENSILIATDVAARGLDIPKIEHVLHYQTPRTSESYVHRSGRTARASNKGITVLIMEPNEFGSYIKLCKTLGKNEDIPIFPVEDRFLNAVKERVNLARQVDKLQLQVKKVSSEEGWLQKAANEMDIIVDGMSKNYDSDETNSNKKLADLKRKQLTILLAKPIFPKGFSGRFPELSLENVTGFNGVSAERKAVDVMQEAINKSSKTKRRVKLYKPKDKTEKKKRDVVIKLGKKNNKISKNRTFKKKRHS